MRKRIVSIMLLITIVLVIPAQAVSTRTIAVVPDIEFNGTEAICTVRITANRTSDKITATMKLWQGSKLIDEWSASGSGILKIHETATVEKNKTYKLTVEYIVNGEMKTPISISRTNK